MIFTERGLAGRARFKALAKAQEDGLELLRLSQSSAAQDQARLETLKADPLVQYAMLD